MNTSNLNSATHYQALAKIIDTAERQGFSITEYTEAGYNENSGYIWVACEDWNFQFGITDFCFNRGEDVECILSEPEMGEEFFGSNPEDVEAQYRTWALEMILDGQLDKEDALFQM